jgi:hypothetical protein
MTSKGRIATTAFLVLALDAASVAQEGSRADETLQLLGGSEISATLIGNYLLTESESSDFVRREWFCTDGFWSMASDRIAAMRGHFSVRTDAFCIEVFTEQHCRQLLRDSSGQLYTRALDASWASEALLLKARTRPVEEPACGGA